MTVTDDHLYLQVAIGIEKMIADDVLKIGDKLPSVRMLSEEYGISMRHRSKDCRDACIHSIGNVFFQFRPLLAVKARLNNRGVR